VSPPFRTYHQVTEPDRSRLGEQVGLQRARVAARLAGVKRTIAVMSGKGGVGKSYVTASLALGAARHLAGGVGVVDADLKSPTVARLLDTRGPVRVSEDGVHPPVSPHGVRVMSTAFLLDDGAPLTWREHPGERFVWRGVLETGALREFLSDVVWGTLDLLLVDLPPGADKLSDLAELIPQLTGAIAVTIPSDESHAAVRRSMQAARQQGVPLLGVIENMSGYECDGCAHTRPLFSGDAGAELAREFDVPLLARVPFRSATAGAPRARDGDIERLVATLCPPDPVIS
jgi:ATP-binding protein involved in chromosome partitioning